MSWNSVDVAVVGGGAIGLSLAWELRQRGASVAVLERGSMYAGPDTPAPRGQATWASAGIIAPVAETTGPNPLRDLGLASLKLYPGFLASLTEASGMKVMLQGPGLLRLAEDAGDAAALRRCFAAQDELGLPLEWLEPAEISRWEPAIVETGYPGLLSPREKHIPPRSLLLALDLAARANGIQLLPNCAAEGFTTNRGRVLAVETACGSLQCGQVVLAAGAWMEDLARQLDLHVPVQPVRGQILALRCALLLSHTVYTHRGYLVPRGDGTLVVGATEEHAKYNSTATTEGVQYLLSLATSLAPALAHAPFHSAWAGLRPDTPDHLPILGPAPGWENVHLATGHFRNGILLTPVTARLMADWILDRRLDPLLRPVGAARFAGPADG